MFSSSTRSIVFRTVLAAVAGGMIIRFVDFESPVVLGVIAGVLGTGLVAIIWWLYKSPQESSPTSRLRNHPVFGSSRMMLIFGIVLAAVLLEPLLSSLDFASGAVLVFFAVFVSVALIAILLWRNKPPQD